MSITLHRVSGPVVSPAPTTALTAPATPVSRPVDSFSRGTSTTALADTARPVAAPAGDYGLSPSDNERILAAYATVREAFPWIPSTVIDREPWVKEILRGVFEGGVYQLSIRVPPERAADKSAIIAALDAQLVGTPLRAVDCGRVLTVSHRGSSKDNAAADFAKACGTQPARIAKFGDQAGEHGNDKHLFDHNSFNVGPEAAHVASVNQSARGEHAKGVVRIVQRLLAEKDAASPRERAQLAVRGFMFDFDDTLTMPGISGIAPEALGMLVGLIRRGEPVCVCTGRGPSILDALLHPLLDSGLSVDELANNVTVMMFNGGRAVRADELRAYAS